MNKRRMLLIGNGKTGNKLVNEMIKKDSRYTGLFVNTAYNDMAKLEKFSDDNAFLFPSANGSGKNRNIAKEYVKGQIKSLVDTIASYPLHDTIVIFTSADGGTGSGVTPMLIQLLHKTFMMKDLNRSINLVAVIPDCNNEDKVSFENTIEFWNEIVAIKDECLNDIKLVDNSKGQTYAEINERVTDELNRAYSMNGEHDEGDIDDADAKKFNIEKGFGLVLPLDNKFRYAKEAIDSALDNSIFAIPNSYECNYLGISLVEGDFKINDVRNCFDTVYKTTYRTYNNKHNTIVLAGCDAPSEIIENIKESLDEINNKNLKRENKSKDLTIDLKDTTNKKNKSKEKATFTEDELDDIASALEDLFD